MKDSIENELSGLWRPHRVSLSRLIMVLCPLATQIFLYFRLSNASNLGHRFGPTIITTNDMEISDPSQPSEGTPLVGDAESPASTATGTSVGATSVREAEAAAPWPATLERGLSLLATPQLGDAKFADAVTKSPRFGYYNAAAGAGGLRQRKVCIFVGMEHMLCDDACIYVLERTMMRSLVFWLGIPTGSRYMPALGPLLSH